MILLLDAQVEELYAHALSVSPAECCGLIGGFERGAAQSIYPLRNVAANALVAYEAAPEELFAAQRMMRERGEQLLGIYHSHPRAVEPLPSETDVRLAYYPAAVYFIIGLAGNKPCLRAFRLSERKGLWDAVEYKVV